MQVGLLPFKSRILFHAAECRSFSRHLNFLKTERCARKVVKVADILFLPENDNKVNPAQKLSQPPTFCACSCTCCQQGRETPSSQAPQCLLSSPSQKVPTSDDALSGCHSPIIKAASMRTEPFFSTYPTFGRRSTVSNEKLGEWVRKQDGDSIQGADSDNGRSIEKSLGAWL